MNSFEIRDRQDEVLQEMYESLPDWYTAREPLANIEKYHILKALDYQQYNRTKAAKMLGIGLRTLQRKLKQYAGA